MADRVVTTDERPRETVVVERDRQETPQRSVGTMIAIIVVVLILLFLLFGRGLFGGGGGGTTNVTVPTPTQSAQ